MAEAVNVTLYTHQGCPGGDAARKYLDARGVPYAVRDVLREKEAQAEFRRAGGIGTPLLLIGGHIMHGFDPEEYERLAALPAERGPGRG